MVDLSIMTWMSIILGTLLLGINVAAQDCPVDLSLVVDRSGSIDRDSTGNRNNINLIINFLNQLVDSLPQGGQNDVEIGLITFGSESTVKFNLGSQNAQGIKDNINDITDDFVGGETNLLAALLDAERSLNMDGRGNARDVVMILTDGVPTDGLTSELRTVASRLRSRATVISIGVSNRFNETLMREITQIFPVITDFDMLSSVVDGISAEICPPSDPPRCNAPQGGVAFSAYSNAPQMMLYELGQTISFGGTYSNYGGHYNTEDSIFTCPCRGMYTFTHTMSMVNPGMGTVVMRNGEPVSPIAYVTPDGAMSTTTIFECHPDDRVYVAVVLQHGGLMPCMYNGMSLHGFTGRLDFLT